jgi:hypothetical protein
MRPKNPLNPAPCHVTWVKRENLSNIFPQGYSQNNVLDSLFAPCACRIFLHILHRRLKKIHLILKIRQDIPRSLANPLGVGLAPFHDHTLRCHLSSFFKLQVRQSILRSSNCFIHFVSSVMVRLGHRGVGSTGRVLFGGC